jgi:hypothetical protein
VIWSIAIVLRHKNLFSLCSISFPGYGVNTKSVSRTNLYFLLFIRAQGGVWFQSYTKFNYLMPNIFAFSIKKNGAKATILKLEVSLI